jgi:hypothetical protein
VTDEEIAEKVAQRMLGVFVEVLNADGVVVVSGHFTSEPWRFAMQSYCSIASVRVDGKITPLHDPKTINLGDVLTVSIR